MFMYYHRRDISISKWKKNYRHSFFVHLCTIYISSVQYTFHSIDLAILLKDKKIHSTKRWLCEKLVTEWGIGGGMLYMAYITYIRQHNLIKLKLHTHTEFLVPIFIRSRRTKKSIYKNLFKHFIHVGKLYAMRRIWSEILK